MLNNGIDVNKIFEEIEVNNNIVLKSENSWDNSDSENININVYEFCKASLAIAKLGNPELEYKELNIPTINLGGYGLLS